MNPLRVTSLIFAAAAWAGCCLLVINSAEAQEEISSKHIPADAFAAVVARPNEALHHEELELMPREIIAASGIKEYGFDPTQIQQFIGIVIARDTFEQAPTFGLILRFDNKPSLSPKLLAGTEKTTLNGRVYFQASEDLAPIVPGFFMPDETTLLIAPNDVMRKMAAADKEDSPLIKMLTTAKPTAAATAYVSLEQIQPQLKAILADAPVPPPFRSLTTLPEHIRAVQVDVNPEKGGLLMSARIAMTAFDETAAKHAEKVIQEGLINGTAMVLELIKRDVGTTDDPVDQATLAYFDRLLKVIPKMLKPKRDGETLVMHLDGDVVTPAVLVALLLPAVNAAPEAARRIQSMNNMKQILLAMHNHHEHKRTFPTAASYDAEGKPLLSWRVHLLPYLDQRELYEKFRLNEPWDSEHNRKLIAEIPAVYVNPNAEADGTTNYLAVTGPRTAFDGNKPLAAKDFTDGFSNTIMLVEADLEGSAPWTKPVDWKFNPDRPLRGLDGFRSGDIFLAGFADGSTQAVSRFEFEPGEHRGLFTRNGGELVDRDDF